MRKFSLLSTVVGMGILLSACTKTPTPSLTSVPTSSPVSDTAQDVKGTLQSLLGSTTAQQCTFADTTADTKVDGTVFISNGKMKSDITTTSPKTTTKMHMIIQSPTMYVWTEGNAQGMKLMMPSSTPGTATAAPTNSSAPSLSQSYSYTCQGWNANDSVFSLPEGVTFMELGVKPSVQPNAKIPGGLSTQCAVCNNIPDADGKASCLEQLHCQ